MARSAEAFWVREPGVGEIRAETLAAPGPGEVLVRTLHSAVSRGTEALVFRGGVPDDLADVMRAPFQVGDFGGPYPAVLAPHPVSISTFNLLHPRLGRHHSY